MNSEPKKHQKRLQHLKYYWVIWCNSSPWPTPQGHVATISDDWACYSNLHETSPINHNSNNSFTWITKIVRARKTGISHCSWSFEPSCWAGTYEDPGRAEIAWTDNPLLSVPTASPKAINSYISNSRGEIRTKTWIAALRPCSKWQMFPGFPTSPKNQWLLNIKRGAMQYESALLDLVAT
jgi:hypothetical protein